ncbi:homeobox domain-containing protein [Apiospora rasikravindrae]|uniref:Homeobox domain-containing protein n=1 Tax=Apiospora rasikravindrae TaxID=990691 RepID=A0ABR1UDI0_9PEZI
MASLHQQSPGPSPTTSIHDGIEDRRASQDASFQSSMSDPDSSALSFETSFHMESGYPVPRPENERHPKGKRKRTTAQDKTILENAYSTNPKPDKAARQDIVNRVTLNEKEVQIWFQNRRQNDRRKSRPLSPQEIAAMRYGGPIHGLSGDSLPFGNAPSIADDSFDTRPAAVEHRAPSPASVGTMHSFRLSPSAANPGPTEQSNPERRASESGVSPSHSIFAVSTNESAQKFSQSLPNSVGYLSNRWNASASFSSPSTLDRQGDESFRLDSFPPSAGSAVDNSPGSILPPPSSSSSQFRLSLSLEGKAELVSSQPSPPRPAQSQVLHDTTKLAPVRPPRILQRSRSALPGITLPPISTLTASLPAQLARGRSRDVHAWESCCDAETRDELTQQAENESSGSAVAAISLLRSSSQTSSGLSSLLNAVAQAASGSVQQPNPGKRNAPPSRRSSLSKKPKLSRSSSGISRMQSLPPPTQATQQPSTDSLDKPETAATEDVEPAKKSPGKPGLAIVLSPGGDSDKENWSPGSDGNSDRRRHPLPSATPTKEQTTVQAVIGNARRVGRVLGEQSPNAANKRSFLGNRANTAPVPRLRGGKAGLETSVSIFEDENGHKKLPSEKSGKGPKGDDEVDRFMMRGQVSPSKRPDMDCVAGLLSLSQGAWR